jgi:hypothetical protein
VPHGQGVARIPPGSAEREAVGLDAGVEEIDSEGPLLDRARLADELVNALLTARAERPADDSSVHHARLAMGGAASYGAMLVTRAEVAEPADATVLNTVGAQAPSGFEPLLRHQFHGRIDYLAPQPRGV